MIDKAYFRQLIGFRFRGLPVTVPLKVALAIPLALNLMAIVSLVGYLSYRSGQRTVELLARHLVTEFSNRIEQTIESRLAISEQLNRLNVAELQSGAVSWREIAGLEAAFIRQLRTFEEVDAIALLERNGSVLSVEQREGERYLLEHVTQQSNGWQHRHISIDATDQRRVLDVVAMNSTTASQRLRPLLAGASATEFGDLRGVAADTTALKAWSVAMSGRSLSIRPRLTLQHVQWIEGDAQQPQALLATQLYLSQLSSFLQSLDLGSGGQAFIVDHQGNLIATSTREPLMQRQDNSARVSAEIAPQANATWQRVAALHSTHPLTRMAAAQLAIAAQDTSSNTSFQPLDFHWQGHRYFAAAKAFQPRPGLAWHIVTVIPETEFLTEIHANLNRTIRLIGVTLLLSTAAALVLARLISTPILNLNRSVQQLAQDDFNLLLRQTTCIRELSELEAGVVHMAQQLKELFTHAESALRVSNEKFAKIFHMSPSASTISTLDTGRLIEVNQSFCQLIGRDRDSIIGSTTVDMGIWPTEQARQQALQQVYHTGSCRNVEVCFQHPSGETRTAIIFAEKIRLWSRDCLLTVAYDITERKCAVEALERSENRLRLLTDALPVYIAYLDTNQRYRFVNKTYETRFGLSRQEICGQHIRHVIGEVSYSLVCGYIEQALAGQSVEYEVAVPLTEEERSAIAAKSKCPAVNDIAYRYLSTVLVPDVNDQGQVVGVYSLVTDISDRKRAEEALRQSEVRNRAVLSAIPDLMMLIRSDGLFVDSVRSNGILDAVPESVNPIGRYVSEFFGKEHTTSKIQAIQRAIATGQVQIYEQKLTIHHTPQYEEVRVVPYNADTALLMIRNITDRKRIEEALRQSEERFRFAFDYAGVGMAIVGLDGRFLQVNQALCDIVGYSETDMLTMQFLDITHTQDLEKTLELDCQLLEGSLRCYQIEKRYVHQRGHVVWVLIIVSLVRDSDGKPLYFLEQIQDISDRRVIQELKDEFLSIVSHELRTPLTSIQGSIGLLKTGIYDAQPQKAQLMMDIAVQECERLVRLVNDILDLERLNSGRVLLEMEPCWVPMLVQRAIDGIQAIADTAHISITHTVCDEYIWGNPDAILQMLTNLLGNAIKFSPPDSTVHICAERLDPADPLLAALPTANSWLKPESVKTVPTTHPEPALSWPHTTAISYVKFAVSDRGRGIPSDKLGLIFERFQQVDASDSRQRGGSGLGLAICQSIIQQHGGKIWVDSVVGEGSTFYFTLPITVTVGA
ncbi:PAS domain S-box protein [Leptolyngbya sp. AN02str]|uniref:PAS domain S-box protein n=1 Tax=Leptolyngbya sp. AN02str TaxID=3423363 RepID=UPI003D3121B6